jgi:hypothetical protein
MIKKTECYALAEGRIKERHCPHLRRQWEPNIQFFLMASPIIPAFECLWLIN